MKDVQTVCLWLGANVMVEYPFDEARKLLTANLQNAKANLLRFVSFLNIYLYFLE